MPAAAVLVAILLRVAHHKVLWDEEVKGVSSNTTVPSSAEEADAEDDNQE